jgi:hypothetical protein
VERTHTGAQESARPPAPGRPLTGGTRVAFRGETILVLGATGRQGGAVTRHLLRDGWRVRALTRKPDGAKARSLAALGAELVRADMGDRASLLAALCGVHGVQNPMTSGLEAEVRQGKLVAQIAREVGVSHLVYDSAGTGQAGTGIGSWESKLAVERRLRELGVPTTVLRPMAFNGADDGQGVVPRRLNAARDADADGWVPSGRLAVRRRPGGDRGEDLRRSRPVRRGGPEARERRAADRVRDHRHTCPGRPIQDRPNGVLVERLDLAFDDVSTDSREVAGEAT